MAYSKGAFASQLGISRGELEKRAKAAGFDTTEAYYMSTGGTGVTQADQVAKEKAQTDEFLGRYNTKVASQPTMQDVWNRVSKERGLEEKRNVFTGLMGSVGNIQEQIQNAPEQIQSETRGFDVNAAQRTRIQQAKEGELAKTLSPIARAAETAGTGYNLALGEAGQQITAEQYQQEKELRPFATEAELLNGALARQMTYYTTDKQNQLSLMLKNLESGGVSDIELQSLADLAKLEREWELKKDYLAYEKSFKTTTGNPVTYKI